MPDSKRRGEFRAWLDAITVASGAFPDRDRQHDLSGGETRLVAHWAHLPVRLGQEGARHPSVRVTLTASIWPGLEEDEG